MTSSLRIYDLASGKTTTIHETDRLIEAPNWTPGGGALIVNGDGLLYRVPLAAPALHRIDTGDLNQLNNDHGLSPDGTRLAISDKTRTGTSEIYTLPVSGGLPEPLGAPLPAYWHGWSPDGATLAYAGKRDGVFQICTMPANGGDETILTQGFDHCDGPDFTPDGRWIWFNGERDGAVDLWRVPVSGGTPERMTDDAQVNWFPHPSPDGAHVLYVAFPSGTEGHPRDRDVELRLLPAEGGAPRTLLALFGGQGTINVPCWAPDSRRFAFVSYARP